MEEIEKFLKKNKITFKALSEQMGYNAEYIYRVLTNRISANPKFLIALETGISGFMKNERDKFDEYKSLNTYEESKQWKEFSKLFY